MRGPDEDLAEGLGQGQVLKLARGDLDRDMRLRPTVGVHLIEVGALDRADQQGEATQRAVVVEALHVLQQGGDLVRQFGAPSFRVRPRRRRPAGRICRRTGRRWRGPRRDSRAGLPPARPATDRDRSAGGSGRGCGSGPRGASLCPAPCTRRLKPSLSVRPFQTAVKASSNGTLTSVKQRSPPRGSSSRNSWTWISVSPVGRRAWPHSSSVFSPMSARIGRTSDSGTAEPRR
jgi:hypothetical protein